ncbi:hypothetical protein NX794_07565 [Streptomyces sp. LP11]|uniref:Uncharacterized protein n=1 Tax=Streptomyces pyxinicus TaxID=2970331 RepID=A0ABT2AXV4_9ACTN|nr:hypothetical protein [Streptomyces sp. LP11]MCS0601088.1 hypothetical protein [Streptomyces sp. LP11]
MKMTVEVTACDLDKEMPAKTFLIMVDGETYKLDLCSSDAQPIVELIAAAKKKGIEPTPMEELIAAVKEEGIEPTPAKPALSAPPTQFTPPSPPAKKAAPRAKKAAASAKKTAASAEEKPAPKKRGGRRPRITSMAEVEAAKAARQGQAQD